MQKDMFEMLNVSLYLDARARCTGSSWSKIRQIVVSQWFLTWSEIEDLLVIFIAKSSKGYAQTCYLSVWNLQYLLYILRVLLTIGLAWITTKQVSKSGFTGCPLWTSHAQCFRPPWFGPQHSHQWVENSAVFLLKGSAWKALHMTLLIHQQSVWTTHR